MPSTLMSILCPKEINVSSYQYTNLRPGHIKQMCLDFQKEKKIWYSDLMWYRELGTILPKSNNK